MIKHNQFFSNKTAYNQKGEVEMGDEEKNEKTNEKTNVWTIVTILIINLAVFALGCLIGHCGAHPKPEQYSNNEIYTVYHVEKTTEKRNGQTLQIGYALVNDSDNGKYKVIYLSALCMETYRPDANILKVGTSGLFYPPCEWLATQK